MKIEIMTTSGRQYYKSNTTMEEIKNTIDFGAANATIVDDEGRIIVVANVEYVQQKGES